MINRAVAQIVADLASIASALGRELGLVRAALVATGIVKGAASMT
jgi:hypothetical protein